MICRLLLFSVMIGRILAEQAEPLGKGVLLVLQTSVLSRIGSAQAYPLPAS
jgi:hypothetical protein